MNTIFNKLIKIFIDLLLLILIIILVSLMLTSIKLNQTISFCEDMEDTVFLYNKLYNYIYELLKSEEFEQYIASLDKQSYTANIVMFFDAEITKEFILAFIEKAKDIILDTSIAYDTRLELIKDMFYQDIQEKYLIYCQEQANQALFHVITSVVITTAFFMIVPGVCYVVGNTTPIIAYNLITNFYPQAENIIDQIPYIQL